MYFQQTKEHNNKTNNSQLSKKKRKREKENIPKISERWRKAGTMEKRCDREREREKNGCVNSRES